MGRDGIEPSNSGLKVQTSHQQARPTACSHNDLVVRGRAAWWRFEAASVPIVCKSAGPYSLAPQAPQRQRRTSLADPTFGDMRVLRGQRPNTTTLPLTFGVGQIGEVIPAATATRWPAPV